MTQPVHCTNVSSTPPPLKMRIQAKLRTSKFVQKGIVTRKRIQAACLRDSVDMYKAVGKAIKKVIKVVIAASRHDRANMAM